MTIAYYIVAGLSAVIFLAAGGMKLVRSREALATSGLVWVEDFTSGPVKLIGAAEIVGAIGLIVPMATGVLPILSPIAGIALAVLMAGATVTHIRRHEPPVPVALILLSAAAAVLGLLLL